MRSCSSSPTGPAIHRTRRSPLNDLDHSIDLDVQAGEMADLLGSGAHLAGFSYGGVIALLAAARRPEAVRSLTVIEPPCLGIARGDPAVDETVAAYEALYGLADVDDSSRASPPSSAPRAGSRRSSRRGRSKARGRLMAEQKPWEAEIPTRRAGAGGASRCSCARAAATRPTRPCATCWSASSAPSGPSCPGAGHGVQWAPRVQRCLRAPSCGATGGEAPDPRPSG